MLNFFKALFGGSRNDGLDADLVARIFEKLEREPSDQLRAILDQSAADRWSPEALHAARVLLEQRASNLAPEPVYRTVPRTQDDQLARFEEPVAPRFDRRLLALDVGSHVYCEWRGKTGTIIRWHDEKDEFYIVYDDGDGDWADFTMFRY